jgi:hypothetical protein
VVEDIQQAPGEEGRRERYGLATVTRVRVPVWVTALSARQAYLIRLGPLPSGARNVPANTCRMQHSLTSIVTRRGPSRHIWSTPHSEHTLRKRRNIAVQRARGELHLRLRAYRSRKMRRIFEGEGSVHPSRKLPHTDVQKQPTSKVYSD